jgi:hypothetical protein
MTPDPLERNRALLSEMLQLDPQEPVRRQVTHLMIAGCVCLVGVSRVVPYHLAVLVNLALLAGTLLFWLRNPGVPLIGKDRSAPSLLPALMLPALVLYLRVFPGVYFVEERGLCEVSAASAFLLATAAFARGNRRSLGALIVAALVGGLLGAVLTAYVDIGFDRSSPALFSPQVLRKRAIRGKRAPRDLLLTGFGPLSGPLEVEVSESIYERVNPSDRVRARLYSGTLSIAWFTIDEP